MKSNTAASSKFRRADDAQLLEACRTGCNDAWEELIRRYGRLVYSIPYRAGLQPEACEDIFQDVFAILVRRLPDLHRPTGLPRWLITTACRVTRQWIERSSSPLPQRAELLRTESPPPELILKWEQQQRVRDALGRLGGRCESLLTALYLEPGDPSYEQIGRRLRMPEGSVGPTRARCLQKLLQVLEAMDCSTP